MCNNYRKFGHKANEFISKTVATKANAQPVVNCYDCGERGHKSNKCLNRVNQKGGNATGRAYAIRDVEQNPGPNVVKGTFLLNNHYVRLLFDSGSDKSFVNTSFSHLIDIEHVRKNTSYKVKLECGLFGWPHSGWWLLMKLSLLLHSQAIYGCTKSQPKSSGKSAHVKEPKFKLGDIDTPQGQERNQGNDND
nr:hypothetical protein [Tanacetum cinerariifolium]